MACGACRKVPYCDVACLESHYLGHMEECFDVIADRVLAGDVHKDDSSGEYVLKDYVGECTAKYGALDERTLRGQRVYWVISSAAREAGGGQGPIAGGTQGAPGLLWPQARRYACLHV